MHTKYNKFDDSQPNRVKLNKPQRGLSARLAKPKPDRAALREMKRYTLDVCHG